MGLRHAIAPILEVNQAALRSYGWTREEFLGLTLRDIRPPAELSSLDVQRAETPHRERHATESLHRTKSGTLRRVEISSYPLEFDGHDARMVLVNDVRNEGGVLLVPAGSRLTSTSAERDMAKRIAWQIEQRCRDVEF